VIRSPIQLLVLGLIATLSAACSPPSGGGLGLRSSRPQVLHVQSGERIIALDPLTGQTRFTSENGFAAPGGTRIFRTLEVVDGTRVEALDGGGSTPVASHTVPERQRAVVASPRGRLVALDQPAETTSPWLAPARAWSTITIADVEADTHRAYRLAGNYAPEAFGAADDRLFLIEYLPPLAPERYRVRQLDLKTGQVRPVGGRSDKSLPAGQVSPIVEEEMRGRSRQQVMAPDFSRLYTLYVHDEDHLHRRDSIELGGIGRPNPDVHAFVHVLDLAEGWAYCLDLPSQFGLGPAQSQGLALSPDGKRLYVVDLTAARMAVADTQELRIMENRPMDVGFTQLDGAPASFRVGPGDTLVVGAGQSLAVLGHHGAVRTKVELDEPVMGLELAPDGRRVFVVGAGGISAVDAATGQYLAVRS